MVAQHTSTMEAIPQRPLLLLTFVVLLSLSGCSHASQRTLQNVQVSIEPNKDPVTVPFDPALLVSSSDIDANDPRVKKQGKGCMQPEQVHLTFWSSTTVLVSWATCDAVLNRTTPVPTDNIRSVVFYGRKSGKLHNRAHGHATSYAYDYTGTNATSYASPVLHHVLLTDLEPGTTYYYRVAEALEDNRDGGYDNGGYHRGHNSDGVYNGGYHNGHNSDGGYDNGGYDKGHDNLWHRHRDSDKGYIDGTDDSTDEAQTERRHSHGGYKKEHREAHHYGKELSFKLPEPDCFPLQIGVIGDPGQTHNTSETLKRLIQSDPQLAILLGDFTYADQWLNENTRAPSGQKVTYQPKWDTWGRLFAPLLSKVPLMHTNGNHEIEPLPSGLRSNSYNHRFPTPQLTSFDYNKGPSFFPAVSQDKPFANLYYTVELPGVMTYISLTSYAPGQTFDHTEAQYVWLSEVLEKIDRTKTPWVIVALHAPWYHTYAGHYKEPGCFRAAYEPLLVRHGVDIVMSGHVHAYERTKPLVEYEVDECGPVYLTVGDGGNIEGIYKSWVDSPTPPPAFCSDPVANNKTLFPWYQPQICYSYQDGKFCPTQQPAWSAYREPSFGYGTLKLLNAKEAKWTWIKNEWPAWKVADEVTISRTSHRAGCGRK